MNHFGLEVTNIYLHICEIIYSTVSVFIYGGLYLERPLATVVRDYSWVAGLERCNIV